MRRVASVAVALLWASAATAQPVFTKPGDATVRLFVATGAASFAGPVTATAPLNGVTQAAQAALSGTFQGSGTNGPATAQSNLTLSLIKKGWYQGTAAVGEGDPLSIIGRQGGGNSSMSGVLINVQNTGTGFLSATEFAASIVDPAQGAVTRAIDTQMNTLNGQTGDYEGVVVNGEVGALKDGVLVQTHGTSAWQNFFRGATAGADKITIDSNGNVRAPGGALTMASAMLASGLAVGDGSPVTYAPGCTMTHDVLAKGLVFACAGVRLMRLPDDGSAPIVRAAPVVGAP